MLNSNTYSYPLHTLGNISERPPVVPATIENVASTSVEYQSLRPQPQESSVNTFARGTLSREDDLEDNNPNHDQEDSQQLGREDDQEDSQQLLSSQLDKKRKLAMAAMFCSTSFTIATVVSACLEVLKVDALATMVGASSFILPASILLFVNYHTKFIEHTQQESAGRGMVNDMGEVILCQVHNPQSHNPVISSELSFDPPLVNHRGILQEELPVQSQDAYQKSSIEEELPVPFQGPARQVADQGDSVVDTDTVTNSVAPLPDDSDSRGSEEAVKKLMEQYMAPPSEDKPSFRHNGIENKQEKPNTSLLPNSSREGGDLSSISRSQSQSLS